MYKHVSISRYNAKFITVAEHDDDDDDDVLLSAVLADYIRCCINSVLFITGIFLISFNYC